MVSSSGGGDPGGPPHEPVRDPHDAPTPPKSPGSLLLDTIKTDLEAGESWLVNEAEEAGLALWNTVKQAFIALGPAEGKILTDVLSGAVTEAAGGKSIEQIENAAMNVASAEERAVLLKAGSGIVQTVIAGMKANTTNPPTTA